MHVSRKGPTWAALAGLGTVIIGPLTHAQQLYGLSSGTPGTLYTINTASGAASPDFTVSGDSMTAFCGIAFLNNTLYASDVKVGSGNSFTFGTINTATGAYQSINNQGGSLDWQSLTADRNDNVLYTVDIDDSFSLKRVTPTGTITKIQGTGHRIIGLAYDNATNVLYGSDNASLYTINTATGATTIVGSFGGVSDTRNDLAIDPNTGNLYLDTGHLQNLYQLDKTTGTATLIGSNGSVDGFGIDGISFGPAPVPEPLPGAVFSVGGLGLAGMMLRARRQRATNR